MGVKDLLHIVEPQSVFWLIDTVKESVLNTRVVSMIDVNSSFLHLWDNVVDVSSHPVKFTGGQNSLWKFFHIFNWKGEREQKRVVQVSINILGVHLKVVFSEIPLRLLPFFNFFLRGLLCD